MRGIRVAMTVGHLTKPQTLGSRSRQVDNMQNLPEVVCVRCPDQEGRQADIHGSFHFLFHYPYITLYDCPIHRQSDPTYSPVYRQSIVKGQQTVSQL